MSIENEIKQLREAIEANTEALLQSSGSKGGSSGSAGKTSEDENETRYFYRKAKKELTSTDDAAEAAKLAKTRGVEEIDEDAYNDILEEQEAAVAEKKRRLAAAKKAAAEEEEEEDPEEEDLLGDDDPEEEEEDELTAEDCKEPLKELRDTKGAPEVKKIFDTLKIKNFKELQDSQAAKCYQLVQKALKAK